MDDQDKSSPREVQRASSQKALRPTEPPGTQTCLRPCRRVLDSSVEVTRARDGFAGHRLRLFLIMAGDPRRRQRPSRAMAAHSAPTATGKASFPSQASEAGAHM